MMKFNSIEDKYGIVYLGNQRYYKEDLTKRDFYLEHCTPAYFKIGHDEFVESSWGHLLQKVADYLIEEYDKTKEELLEFSVDWSKQKIFLVQKKAAYLELKNGMFINTNHTAVHCCWILQDLLKFFNVDLKECELIIKRKPIAEATEVKDYYNAAVKEMFKEYVINKLKKTEEFYDKCITVLDKIDVLFKREFKTFESIYLIDNPALFSNYKSRFIHYLMNLGYYDLKTFEAIEKRLDYYAKFVYSSFY